MLIRNQKINCFGFLLMAFLIFSGSGASNFSAPESWATKGHKKVSRGVLIPKTLPKLWADITVMRSKIDENLEDGNISEIHKMIYGIRDHVTALYKKSSHTLSKAKLEKLKERISFVSKLAGDLDELAEERKLQAVRALIKGFDGEIQSIKNLYPVEDLVAEGTYSCPVQPEILSASFGKCSECGMDFILAK